VWFAIAICRAAGQNTIMRRRHGSRRSQALRVGTAGHRKPSNTPFLCSLGSRQAITKYLNSSDKCAGRDHHREHGARTGGYLAAGGGYLRSTSALKGREGSSLPCARATHHRAPQWPNATRSSCIAALGFRGATAGCVRASRRDHACVNTPSCFASAELPDEHADGARGVGAGRVHDGEADDPGDERVPPPVGLRGGGRGP
jgi:hypothetical protein